MNIRERQVNFRIEKINQVYGITNSNIEQFYAKACTPRTWMVDILCDGKEVPWGTTKRNILMNDLISKAMLWLNIVYIQVLSFTQITIFTNRWASSYGVLSSLQHHPKYGRDCALKIYILHKSWRYISSLGPSLIIELYTRAQVEEYAIDTWVSIGPHIFSLKFRGEGDLVQSKREGGLEKISLRVHRLLQTLTIHRLQCR